MRNLLRAAALSAGLVFLGAASALAQAPAASADSAAAPLKGDAAQAAKVVDAFHAALDAVIRPAPRP